MKKQKAYLLTSIVCFVLAVFFLGLMFQGCATTPKQKQLITIESFNSIYKQYLDEYDAQPISVRQRWKKNVDPYWETASDAIKLYIESRNINSADTEY